MKYKKISHKDAELLMNSKYAKEFSEIISAIEGITDLMLINKFNELSQKRKSQKSLSVTINELLKENLTQKGWESEAAIFRDKPYTKKNSTRWRLDFAKENSIAVEVAFNHGEAIAHNLIKPVLASEQNHVRRDVETKIGLIITATDNLKKKGNFDSAVGSFEKFESYLKPYAHILTVPVLLIGLEAPDSFYIDKKSKKVVKP